MTDTAELKPARTALLRTVEGEQLRQLAASIKVGETLTYERVLAEIKVDLQSNAGRQLWLKAQNDLAADKGLQFICVPKVGYRLLAENEKVDKSGRFIGQAAGRVRAAARVIGTTDREKLSPEKQNAYDVQGAVITVMGHVARQATKVTAGGNAPRKELDSVLEAVRGLG